MMTEQSRPTGRRQFMATVSRRSVLSGSVGVAAATALPRPHIAKAAATTATVWWQQGFIREEDAAFRRLVADYEKASSNKIDYSIMPFMALGQKAVAALTSGEVPDIITYGGVPLAPQNAWDDKLIEVTDVVETQKSQFSQTALLASHYYNNVTRRRDFYLVPCYASATPFHVWRSLVEQADYRIEDAPATWDAYWDFFKPVQNSLRAKGNRKVYGLGLQVTTVGPFDGNNLFAHFLIANGGKDIVTRDGSLHTGDPNMREAAIKSVAYMTTAYKEGYVPREALSWNDADDNNAFHAKAIVMDFDATISTELALIQNRSEYDDIMTQALPLGNDGRPMPVVFLVTGAFIPKGARNVLVAKDFLTYLIQPQNLNEYLKSGLGRFVPTIPALLQRDPFWLDPSDPHRSAYVRELLGPTIPPYIAFNPGWAQVEAEQLWGQAHADVVKNGLSPAAAVDKAFRRAEAIFARYPIVQS
jgi:multiple sugar transport system substrate-binding protein